MRKRIISLALSMLMLLCLFPAVASAEPNAWGVIGNICGTNWDTDFGMTEIEADVWASEELDLHAGEMLKVRFGGEWTQNFGIAYDWNESEPVVCCQDGRNLVIPVDGAYVVTLYLGDPTTVTLTCGGETVLPQTESEEPGGDIWTVIGSIFGTYWNTDYEMNEIEDGVWQAGPWQMEAGWEFKVRCNFDWECANYGMANGDNCVIAEDGVYLITLDLNVENPTVAWELTDDEPEDPVIVGPNDPGEELKRVPLSEENFPDAQFRAWIAAQDWTEEEDDVTYLCGWARGNDWIDCAGQGIADLTGIQYFPYLRYLIAGESYEENDNGDWILAGTNALTSFDALLTPNLVELSITGSDVTALDVSSLTNLERLWCGGNGMTSLTLGNLPHLEYLNAGDLSWYEGNDEWKSKKNLLEALDLSGVPNLKELNVNGNLLTALDLSGFANLERLECSDNPITSLTLPVHPICGWLGLSEVEPTDNGNGTWSFDLSALLDPTAYSFEMIDTSEWDESKSLNTATGVVTFAYQPDREQFCVKETIVHNEDRKEDLWLNIDFVGGGEPYNPDEPDYPYVSDEGIDPATAFNFASDDIWFSGDEPFIPDPSEWPEAPAYEGGLDDVPIDEAHFPDANFREWILRKIDHETVTDEETGEETYLLTGEQRWNVAVIDCRGRHIESLAGIEYFPNLEWLYCGRMLTEYVPEYAFWLYASNPITELNLSHNPKLTRLCANYCNLSSIDLSHNPALTHLNLFYNELTALDLSGNPNIEKLNITVNDIEQVDLSALPNLKEFCCGFTKLVDVDLSGRAEMTAIQCHNIDTLETLNLNGCVNLDPTECEIHSFYTLHELRCRSCGLDTLPGGAPNIRILDCGNNEQFTSLDLSDYRELTELYCDNCSLYRLDISLNQKLTILDCSYNHLKELNFILVPGTQEYGGEFYGQGQTAVCAAGMEASGDVFTFDMANLVSAENLDRIVSVDGATYDSNTGTATFVEAAETLVYSYETQPSGIEYFSIPMTVMVTLNAEIPELPEGAIPIDAEHFPDANFRAWILKTLTPYYTEDAFGRQYLTDKREDALYFDLTGLEIASIEGLKYFPNAFGLFLGDGYRQDENGEWVWHSNYLTEVDLHENTNLGEVHLNHNQLTELDVSGLPILQWLNCSDNQLSVIDVSHNANLAVLWCNGNGAYTLNLPNGYVHVYPNMRGDGEERMNQLARVECEGNQLASLDLSGLPTLKELNCENNKLTALNLSDSENLGLLDCDDDVDITLPEGMAFHAEMTINDDEKTYRCTSLSAAIDKITGRDSVTSPDEVQSAYITLFDNQEGPALVFAADQQKTVVIDLNGHTYGAWEEPVLVAYDNNVTVINGEIVFKQMPAFRTHSLVLSGQIGVNFYMDLPAIDGVDWSTSYMTFTIPHGPVTERDNYDPAATNKKGTYYCFTAYVNAVQMAETITATFHWFENGEEKTIESGCSIKDYVNRYVSGVENGTITTDNETLALVKAVADYGHYVQIFLSAERNWTIGTDYAEMDLHYAENYDITAIMTAVSGYAIVKDDQTDGDIEAITYALLLDSETAIKVYFTPSSEYTGTPSVTVDGNAYTAKKTGGRYVVVIPNISAHQLIVSHTIELTTTKGTATVKVSALSYVKGALDYYTDAGSQNALAAIYAYASAAKEYKAAHSN